MVLSYNAYGQVTSIDGPRTDVASLTYYECNTGYGCGQLKTATNALGHTTTYDSYDARSGPTIPHIPLSETSALI